MRIRHHINIRTFLGVSLAVFGVVFFLAPKAFALTVTFGPEVQALSSTSVTLYWETDVPSDSRVDVTTGSTTITRENTNTFTAHAIIVDSLTPSTTYTYTVQSSDGTDTVVAPSPPGSFTTTVPSSDIEPPAILSPFANTVCGSASCTTSISFQTSEDASAEVMYGEAAATIGPLTGSCIVGVDCSFNISPLPLSTNYVYTVRLEDAAGNFRLYGPLKFKTCEAPGRICFSPGQCEDGTPLDTCNTKGEYCDGGNLVLNCMECGFQCQVGATCKIGGSCIQDPKITDTTYQCNPSSCYDSNNDFITPAGAGCFESWPACNSNIVLKVRNDRECKRWISCKSAVEVEDPVTNTVQQLCTELGNCAQLDLATGQCAKFLGEGQCELNPLRFCDEDEDCEVFEEGTCIPRVNGPTELTLDQSRNLDDIRFVTGSAKVGLVYKDGNTVQGQYPWALASQIGTAVSAIDNSEFEDLEEFSELNENGVMVQRKRFSARPWTAVGGRDTDRDTEGKTAKVEADREDPANLNNPNHVLWIYPNGNNYSGARAPVSGFFSASARTDYQVSLRIKTTGLDEQFAIVQLISPEQSTDEDSFPNTARRLVKLTTDWQEISFTARGISDTTYLQVVNFKAGFCSDGTRCVDSKDCAGSTNFCVVELDAPLAQNPILIDDVYVQPVLQVGANFPEDFISRSCRLFPRQDSLSCAYEDKDGLKYRGWSGYCLETDPQDTGRCLSWWPVDVIGGDTAVLGSFGGEKEAGYTNRIPLYYCLEAKGNFNAAENSYARNAHVTGKPGPGPWGNNCDGKGETNALRSFRVCGDEVEDSWEVGADWEESGLYEYDIEGIELKRVNHRPEYRDRIFIDVTHRFSDSDTNDLNGSPGDGIWEYKEEDTGDGRRNEFTFRAIFDATTQKLKGYYAFTNDVTGNTREPGEFVIIFHLREWCSKLVQVVDESGANKVWNQRVQLNSSYRVGALNYGVTQDFVPFGGIVQPAGSPESWDGDSTLIGQQPLYIEAPQTNDPQFDQVPYQARAGSPYACVGDCSGRICAAAGDKTGIACREATDCVGNDPTLGTVTGRCIGVGTCEFTAKACTDDNDCPELPAGGNDRCIGGAASGRGEQVFSNQAKHCLLTGESCQQTQDCPTLPNNAPNPCSSTKSGQTFAANRLQRLFAKSYDAWTWNYNLRQYVRAKDSSGNVPLWNPPGEVCNPRFCTEGPERACSTNDECGGIGDCSDEPHPAHRPANFNELYPSGDYCGIPPKVFNVTVNEEKNIFVSGGSLVTLRFNTTADPNQLPLESISINWNDGSEVQGLSFPYAPRENMDAPHVFTHTYECTPSSKNAQNDPVYQNGICTYKPKILVRDNWGFCNNFWNSENPDSKVPCLTGTGSLDTWAPNENATEPSGEQQVEVIVQVSE